MTAQEQQKRIERIIQMIRNEEENMAQEFLALFESKSLKPSTKLHILDKLDSKQMDVLIFAIRDIQKNIVGIQYDMQRFRYMLIPVKKGKVGSRDLVSQPKIWLKISTIAKKNFTVIQAILNAHGDNTVAYVVSCAILVIFAACFIIICYKQGIYCWKNNQPEEREQDGYHPQLKIDFRESIEIEGGRGDSAKRVRKKDRQSKQKITNKSKQYNTEPNKNVPSKLIPQEIQKSGYDLQRKDLDDKKRPTVDVDTEHRGE